LRWVIKLWVIGSLRWVIRSLNYCFGVILNRQISNSTHLQIIKSTNIYKVAKQNYLVLLLILFFITACGSSSYVPKPKGYNRIDLPEVKYKLLEGDYPYKFEHSAYVEVRPDSAKIAEKYWIHLKYNRFKADVQLTYKNVQQDPKFFSEFVDDSHKLISKHFIKASGVEESLLKTKSGKTAAVYVLEGEVPSQFQFYVSDSTTHFLRGALYFRTSTKNDSLAPVIDYIKKDIIHMLETLQWKGEK
jgi:gliding motility-associated lipoprotein GldD